MLPARRTLRSPSCIPASLLHLFRRDLPLFKVNFINVKEVNPCAPPSRALSRPAAARYFTSFYFIYTQPAYLVDVVITLRRVVQRICRAAALIILVLLHPHAYRYFNILWAFTHSRVSLALFSLGHGWKSIYAVDIAVIFPLSLLWSNRPFSTCNKLLPISAQLWVLLFWNL